MAIKFSQILKPDHVVLEIKATDKAGALAELAEHLRNDGRVVDFKGFFKEIVAREAFGATALGNEVALPHARTNDVSELVLVVGRCRNPINYSEGGSVPIRLVFMLGVPKKQVQEYLNFVGQLTRGLKHSELREKLFNATSAGEFIGVLDKIGSSV